MHDARKHPKNTAKSAFLLLPLLLVCLLFAGCGSNSTLTYENAIKILNKDEEPNFHCTVQEVRDRYLLVRPAENEEIRNSAIEITVPLYTTDEDGHDVAVPVFVMPEPGDDMGEEGAPVENYAFSAGDTLSVCYSGDVAETYPAQISRVSFLLVTGFDSDVARDPTLSDEAHTESEFWGWEMDESSTVSYVMEHQESADTDAYTPYAPTVSLDAGHQTFMFTTSVLSSYLPCGTYTAGSLPEDGTPVLTLRTNDGLYTYCFAVLDDNTLQFLQNYSSDTDNYDDRIELPVTDGARFLKTERQ